MSAKNRAYCFTLNNYSDSDVEEIKCWSNPKYLIVDKEVGKSGTPHLQGYVYWTNPRAFNSMKKLLPRAHWEIAKSCAADNKKYCSKDDDYFEIGEMPSQGKRTELNEVKDRIVEGAKVDDIIMENPTLGHQYGRTLDRIEDIAMRKRFREEMTEGLRLWIVTGKRFYL